MNDIIAVITILLCGAPLYVASWILWDMVLDNWADECKHCHSLVSLDGCRCGKTPYTGSH